MRDDKPGAKFRLRWLWIGTEIDSLDHWQSTA
jgi:hypothetical protein